ncbi:MAG: hypothetical protein MMC23_005280 [Stictis urceolatum]|nr:hypothetical protein [Stictis urceolata]
MPASFSTVLYPKKDGAKFDMDYYMSSHMPLVENRWSKYGLVSWKVVELSEGPYGVQAILEWKDETGMPKAKESPEGDEVFGDVPKFSSEAPVLCVGNLKGASK